MGQGSAGAETTGRAGQHRAARHRAGQGGDNSMQQGAGSHQQQAGSRRASSDVWKGGDTGPRCPLPSSHKGVRQRAGWRLPPVTSVSKDSLKQACVETARLLQPQQPHNTGQEEPAPAAAGATAPCTLQTPTVTLPRSTITHAHTHTHTLTHPHLLCKG